MRSLIVYIDIFGRKILQYSGSVSEASYLFPFHRTAALLQCFNFQCCLQCFVTRQFAGPSLHALIAYPLFIILSIFLIPSELWLLMVLIITSVGDDLTQMIIKSRFKSFLTTYDFDLNQFSSHDS